MSTMPSAPTQPAQEPDPKVRVKLTMNQLVEHRKQWRTSVDLKQKLNMPTDNLNDATNPPQPLKELVSYLNSVTALTASFVFCGHKADEEVADPEAQLKHDIKQIISGTS